MDKDKSAKRNKKPGKLKDLPAKGKRAGAVKGGATVTSFSASSAGSGDVRPTESLSLN